MPQFRGAVPAMGSMPKRTIMQIWLRSRAEILPKVFVTTHSTNVRSNATVARNRFSVCKSRDTINYLTRRNANRGIVHVQNHVRRTPYELRGNGLVQLAWHESVNRTSNGTDYASVALYAGQNLPEGHLLPPGLDTSPCNVL